MSRLLIFLCIIIQVKALFEFDCPIGCADSTCTTLGCFTCSSNYCLHFSSGMGICLQQCPTEYGCYHGLKSVCTKCGIDHCDECTVTGNGHDVTCTKCSFRYTPSPTGKTCIRN